MWAGAPTEASSCRALWQADLRYVCCRSTTTTPGCCRGFAEPLLVPQPRTKKCESSSVRLKLESHPLEIGIVCGSRQGGPLLSMLGPGSGGRGTTMPAGSTGTRFGDAVQFTRTFPAGDEDLRAITKAPQKKSLDPDTSGKATVCLLSPLAQHPPTTVWTTPCSFVAVMKTRSCRGRGLDVACCHVQPRVCDGMYTNTYGILRLFFVTVRSLCLRSRARADESERESRSLPWPAEPADTLQRDCHSVENSTAFDALVWG